MTVAERKILDSRTYSLQDEIEEEEEIQLIDGKWFEGFAIGEFTDMFGREIEITEEDLDFYLKNTRKAIRATKELESEEIGGLPIDARDHERGEAAGWIVSVKMSDEGDKLLFKPKWTVIGQDLLKSKLMRGFSATFSLEDMVIMGGTLTNWPATREDSVPILAPIELSETNIAEKVFIRLSNLFKQTPENQEEISNEGVPMTKKVKLNIEDLTEDQVSELSVQLVDKLSESNGSGAVNLEQYIEVQVDTRADEKIKHALVLAKKKKTVASFVTEMTEGTEEDPNGIGVKPEDLSDLLSGLDEDQLELAMKIIKTIKANGVVNFEELGDDGEVKGKKELPKEVQTALDDGTLKVKDLGMSSMNLGDLDQYNLSKYQKKEKK